MDYLSLIKQPISTEIADFIELFNQSLSHSDGMLGQALEHIRKRAGKRMRPMLILLMAKNFGTISAATQHAAVGLELLHTASLVHDDVVDESAERRGQASVNATYNNKVAVLVGDYILSTALLNVAKTGNQRIVEYLAELGRTLSNGEILQLTNIQNQEISEDVYYQVIKQKTAALFEACAAIGALSAGASEEMVAEAKHFGQNLGIIFQIRDDIFDYYPSTKEVGKPTGHDIMEGKITLPLLYALQHAPADEAARMKAIIEQPQELTGSQVAQLVEFAKSIGGIEYAQAKMKNISYEAKKLLSTFPESDAREAVMCLIDYFSDRNY